MVRVYIQIQIGGEESGFADCISIFPLHLGMEGRKRYLAHCRRGVGGGGENREVGGASVVE